LLIINDWEAAAVDCEADDEIVSWKSRVIGFGHAELDIGDADTTEIARLYRGHIPVL
jgi:hypothetical protein